MRDLLSVRTAGGTADVRDVDWLASGRLSEGSRGLGERDEGLLDGRTFCTDDFPTVE